MTSGSRIAHASPVPAQTMFGFDGATARAPIACTGIESKTGRNVTPLSLDFQMPPEAAPTYQTRGLPGTPVIAENRPPPAGPIIWKRNGSSAGGRAVPRPGGCAAAKLVWTSRTATMMGCLALIDIAFSLSGVIDQPYFFARGEQGDE